MDTYYSHVLYSGNVFFPAIRIDPFNSQIWLLFFFIFVIYVLFYILREGIPKYLEGGELIDCFWLEKQFYRIIIIQNRFITI